MIVSLRLKENRTFEVDRHNRISVNGEIIRVKEVPIMRYTKINEEYIRKQMKIFEKSVHLIETNTENMETMKQDIEIAEKLGLPVIVYAKILTGTDEEIDAIIKSLNSIDYDGIEKLQVIDAENILDYITYMKIEKSLSSALKLDVGICCSPVGGENKQCINAIKARELQAHYTDAVGVPLVTQKHEGTEGSVCKCVKYLNITSDTKLSAPKSQVKVDSEVKKKENASEKKKPKVISVPKIDL